VIRRRSRAIQIERYAAIGLPQVRGNAMVAGPVMEDVAKPDASGLTLLRDAANAVGCVHPAETPSYRALATRCDVGAPCAERMHQPQTLAWERRGGA
jgi:magnesium chelatase family protein